MLSLLLKILKVLNLGAFMSAKCDLIPHQTVNTVKYFTQILGQLFRRGKSYKLLKPNEVGRFEIVCPYLATRNVAVKNANSILSN